MQGAHNLSHKNVNPNRLLYMAEENLFDRPKILGSNHYDILIVYVSLDYRLYYTIYTYITC